MDQFLNWINFISKLVQYFLNWFILFQTSLIFLNWLIFIQTSLIFFSWFTFFSNRFNFFGNQFNFLKLVHFLGNLFFFKWYVKKKWVVLHISLSPLSPLLITLSFCVPTLPQLLKLPEDFFHSKTNNFYLNEI